MPKFLLSALALFVIGFGLLALLWVTAWPFLVKAIIAFVAGLILAGAVEAAMDREEWDKW